MSKNKTYIIDFDSTFTKVEALDELAHIVLEGNENKISIEHTIIDITNKAMSGEISFDLALKQRLDLLPIHKTHLEQLIVILKQNVSASFIRNEKKIRALAGSIYIISGGFKEFIIPVVCEYGIASDHVFANDFLFDEDGKAIGYNHDNFLSQAKGKVKLLESLHLQGEIIVIGDGYTDYEIREAGFASAFYLFVENIKREHLILKADKIIASLDELFMTKENI